MCYVLYVRSILFLYETSTLLPNSLLPNKKLQYFINYLIPISEPLRSCHLIFHPHLTNSHCNYTENSMPFYLASP